MLCSDSNLKICRWYQPGRRWFRPKVVLGMTCTWRRTCNVAQAWYSWKTEETHKQQRINQMMFSKICALCNLDLTFLLWYTQAGNSSTLQDHITSLSFLTSYQARAQLLSQTTQQNWITSPMGSLSWLTAFYNFNEIQADYNSSAILISKTY